MEVRKCDLADKVLVSNKSDDQKLYEVFQIYKDDLQRKFPALYYALLGWRDAHLKEFRKFIPGIGEVPEFKGVAEEVAGTAGDILNGLEAQILGNDTASKSREGFVCVWNSEEPDPTIEEYKQLFTGLHVEVTRCGTVNIMEAWNTGDVGLEQQEVLKLLYGIDSLRLGGSLLIHCRRKYDKVTVYNAFAGSADKVFANTLEYIHQIVRTSCVDFTLTAEVHDAIVCAIQRVYIITHN